MTNTDPILGQKVHKALLARKVETPMKGTLIPTTLVQDSVCDIMTALGLDMSDDSLKDTPKRVAKMYLHEVFSGLDYNNFPACSIFSNKMQYDEVVLETGISVKSFCEHHLLPFFGHAVIGYIPNKGVLGLSKLNRLADFFSRRPQVQERLTEQLYWALSTVLETEDVAVIIKAKHMCVYMRGIQDADSETITSKLGGRFRSDLALRTEFITLSQRRD